MNPTPPPDAGTVHRIDLRQATDTAYWCRVLGVDTHQLRSAVQQVGPQAAAVRRYLERQGTARPSP